MAVLADLRERLALPSRDTAPRATGQIPAAGTIVPFPVPTSVTAPGQWPYSMGAPPPKQGVIAGGRQSWDDQFTFGAGIPVVLPPDQSIDEWRRLDLDSERVKFMPASRLLEILTDASPDVSRALWDFLRLTNPGWKVTVYKAGTRNPSPEGQAVVDDWVRALNKRYGSMDVPLARIHFGAFLRGGIMTELVLDADAKTPLDLATPDPASARFRQAIDPVLGRVWTLGQFQGGAWVDLSARDTISYIPIDPAPANPYGRPPCGPAVFSSLFMLGVLHDLRRVVAQQGYPRYDLSVSLEMLRKSTPPSVFQDPAAWKTWVDNTISEIQNAYNALEPDSALVHTDVVTVNRPVGAVSADALAGIDPLIRALERQTARALKTVPLLMGIIEGQSEANANRQWEIYAAGIKSIQNLSETDLSEKCTLICEANGIAAEAEWIFEEFRAAEAYRDAMTKGLEIDNASKLYLMGIIDQETFADMTTGEPPDQKEPRYLPSSEQPFGASVATTTQSPRQDGQPAGTKDEGNEPNAPTHKPGDDTTEEGDSQDPNARIGFKLKWPDWGILRPAERQPQALQPNGQNGHLQNGPTVQPVEGRASDFHPAGMPLAYLPDEVVYDDGDRRRLLAEWDATVPEAAGLLNANVETKRVPTDTVSRVQKTIDRDPDGTIRRVVELRPDGRQLRKDIWRDTDGRITDIVEEILGVPGQMRKKVERDDGGRIIRVIEETVGAR